MTALANFIDGLPILSLVTFLPLVGAAIILSVRGSAETVARQARYIALWTTVIVFVLSIFIWIGFDSSTAAFQFEERIDWLPQYKITYRMGVDGISMLFVILSTFLMPLCILASWESVQKMVREYMVAF